MKKAARILSLLLIFTISTNAQKREKKKEKPQFSIEQRTTLAIKKMTLALGLTSEQQVKVKPLISDKFADKKALKIKMKAAKKTKKKLTTQERFEMINKRLDKEIAFQNSMKQILTKEQFEKFLKKKSRKVNKLKKRVRKHKEENSDRN